MHLTTFASLALLSFAATGHAAANGTGKVDVHSHYLPAFYVKALIEAGHVPGPDGMPAIPVWDPVAHVKFMDEQGIDKSFMSVSSPGVYLTVPSKKATKKAIKLARQMNTYGSQLKAQYPDRFGFFASLPLPDVQASLKEIEHCFTKLNPKPDGIAMLSNYYGMYLGDPALDPIYEALNELNVTIFGHPTTPCTEYNHMQYAIDGNAPLITQQQWQNLNRPVAHQAPAPVMDFPFDSARTFADLFYSTVPTRFPNLTWIIPHAGGGVLPVLDRIISFHHLHPGFNMTEDLMKEILGRSFYFDLAGPWRVNWAIPALMRWVDYTNIVWGSDAVFTPFATVAAVIVAFEEGLKEVFKDEDHAASVRGRNALRLLES